MILHKNFVFLIFGYFCAVYTDNKSYFMNKLMKNYYKNCRITHYIRLISYPLSIKLFEKAI